jgi:hypothetical protein
VTSCCVSWCSYFADADDSLPPSGSTDEGDCVALAEEECQKAAKEYYKATRLYSKAYKSLQTLSKTADPKKLEEKLIKLSNMEFAQDKALDTKRQKQDNLDMVRGVRRTRQKWQRRLKKAIAAKQRIS